MGWFRKREKSFLEEYRDRHGIDPAALADMRLHPTIDLTPLAKSLGGEVRPCEHINDNVGEVQYQELRAKRRGFRIRVGINKSRVECTVMALDTAIAFSVNQSDQVMRYFEPLNRALPGLTLPVFSSERYLGSVAAWLQVREHAALVTALHLAADESLHVARNGLYLVGRPSRASMQTIEQLCDLAEVLRTASDPELIDGLTFDPEKVPVNLRALEPLARRFAVGDDELRTELLADATPHEREQLSQRVTPLLSRIDAFLDTSGESDEAILLGRLAEAACEINRRDA